MRFIPTMLALFVALIGLSMVKAFCVDNDQFTPFIVSNLRPKPLNSEKAKMIKEGMTLKELVAALGPGWMSPYEGVGTFAWFFTDGRQLNVLPSGDGPLKYESETLSYKGGHGLAYKWWDSPPFR
jgi:hypothetical protein